MFEVMSESAQYATGGARLHELRVAAGLSAAELARMAGLAGNTILNAERGAVPSLANQRAIVDALNEALAVAGQRAYRPVADAEADVMEARRRLVNAQRRHARLEERWQETREQYRIENPAEVWPSEQVAA
jgi:transcriptional regulator with XRE-family HTH domain